MKLATIGFAAALALSSSLAFAQNSSTSGSSANTGTTGSPGTSSMSSGTTGSNSSSQADYNASVKDGSAPG